MVMNSPSVTMTIVSGPACSTGRMTSRSMMTAPMNAMTSVQMKASHIGIPIVMSCQAMNVLNIAISPCAKLMTFIER